MIAFRNVMLVLKCGAGAHVGRDPNAKIKTK